MNKIQYLIGNKNVEWFSTKPYDKIICNFLDALSSELRSSQAAKDYPDILTFAFWCRKGNIQKLKEKFGEETRLGLGRVFHIAPSNVSINFAFSFVFGLLAGNANIVRVPSKLFPQVDIVCDCIRKLFEKDDYHGIRDSTAFVRYERDDTITTVFSQAADARIIWGGDKTIRSLRSLPSRERCVDVVFADRYSFSIMDLSSLKDLSKTKIERLALSFYNDTYFIDQNACSSPHLIIWFGKKNNKKEIFWETLSNIIDKKYDLKDISVMDKYAQFCHDAIDTKQISTIKMHKNNIYRVELMKLPAEVDKLRGKYGYFYEYTCNDINSLAPIITKKFQTLTYFGVDKSLLKEFVLKNKIPGIDRIVPIGQALDIDVVWDGYDIIRSLSRIVDVR